MSGPRPKNGKHIFVPSGCYVSPRSLGYYCWKKLTFLNNYSLTHEVHASYLGSPWMEIHWNLKDLIKIGKHKAWCFNYEHVSVWMCFYGALVHKTQDITSTKSWIICILFRIRANATVDEILAWCSMFGKDFVLVFDTRSRARVPSSLSFSESPHWWDNIRSRHTWLWKCFPDYALVMHVGVCSPLGVCT